MIVVSDTSPIINLAMIGRLELLPALFGEVIIPYKVFEEITQRGGTMPGAEAVLAARWVETRSCTNTVLVQALRTQLDSGEAEAIALALELESGLLLIDEKMGRQVARGFSLSVMGLIGVLTLAKRKGFILEMKSVLDELIQRAGFRISDDLYQAVLKKEGELPG